VSCTRRWPKDCLHSYRDEKILDWHHSDPDRIATFWADPPPKDCRQWIAEKRQLGREYVEKFIHVNRGIREKVDEFHKVHLGNCFTIGVHIRGTDFAYAEPTPPSSYLSAINAHMREKDLKEYKIFLATDQVQFVELFREEFGSRLVTTECGRSRSDLPPFRLSTPCLSG